MKEQTVEQKAEQFKAERKQEFINRFKTAFALGQLMIGTDEAVDSLVTGVVDTLMMCAEQMTEHEETITSLEARIHELEAEVVKQAKTIKYRSEELIDLRRKQGDYRPLCIDEHFENHADCEDCSQHDECFLNGGIEELEEVKYTIADGFGGDK